MESFFSLIALLLALGWALWPRGRARSTLSLLALMTWAPLGCSDDKKSRGDEDDEDRDRDEDDRDRDEDDRDRDEDDRDRDEDDRRGPEREQRKVYTFEDQTCSNPQLSVDKIIIDDTDTEVWMSVSSRMGSYEIHAPGTKAAFQLNILNFKAPSTTSLTGVDDVALSPAKLSPSAGDRSFRLFFPALPPDVRRSLDRDVLEISLTEGSIGYAERNRGYWVCDDIELR